MLCTPLVHNKGVSCTTQTVDTEVQTGKIHFLDSWMLKQINCFAMWWQNCKYKKSGWGSEEQEGGLAKDVTHSALFSRLKSFLSVSFCFVKTFSSPRKKRFLFQCQFMFLCPWTCTVSTHRSLWSFLCLYVKHLRHLSWTLFYCDHT